MHSLAAMSVYLSLVFWRIFFLLLCAYVVWLWVRWLRLPETVTPKWRAGAAVAGFCLATFSTVLSVFLFIHAAFTGGYPFDHPVEVFCLRWGFLAALLGLVAGAAGKGRLRPHIAVISTLNLLLWFMDAMAR
jgi:hypothetical protein